MVKSVRLNTERVKYWLSVGAEASEPVARLFSRFELLPRQPVRSPAKVFHHTAIPAPAWWSGAGVDTRPLWAGKAADKPATGFI
jgi:hypothetical protein